LFNLYRVLWQIKFAVLHASRDITPKFVHHITEKLLEPSFSVVGQNLRKYALFEEAYDIYRVFHRSVAFTLTFTEAVYEADWAMIEASIKADWCSRFGMFIFLRNSETKFM
jgi:hypothetical protein